MAAIGILLGVAGAGYLLNQNDVHKDAVVPVAQQPKARVQIQGQVPYNNGGQQVHASRQPDDYNLLSSNRSVKVNKKMKAMGERQTALAADPMATGVVPQRYNADSQGTPSYAYQTYSSKDANIIEHFSNEVGGVDAAGSVTAGLFGVQRPSERANYPYPMTHNNMVPFFRGSSTKQPGIDAGSRRMEQFSGTDDLARVGKREVEAMFKPQPQEIHGNTIPLDDIQNRYVAGSQQNNVLPFQQLKVTPGLNQDYLDVGTDARHPMFRPKIRNIDETRPLTRPQVSYDTPFVSGKGVTENPAEPVPVMRQRPALPTELDGGLWGAAGAGDQQQKMEENFHAPNSNREMDGVYSTAFGGGDAVQREPAASGLVRDPNGKQLEGQYDTNYEEQGGGRGKWVMDENDVIEFTRRDMVKSDAVITGGDSERGHWVKSPTDIPAVTKRQGIDEQSYGLTNGYYEKNLGYLTNKFVASVTKRQVHSLAYVGSGVADNADAMSRQQYENDQSNSIKETTQFRPSPTPVGPAVAVGSDRISMKDDRVTLDVRSAIPVDEQIPDVYDNLIRSVVNPTKQKQRYNQRNLMNPGLQDQLASNDMVLDITENGLAP